MIPKQFNAERLTKYARYLQFEKKLKCEKFYSTVSNAKAVDELVETGKLRPLLIMPIMELPLIFPGEWFYGSDYMPV